MCNPAYCGLIPSSRVAAGMAFGVKPWGKMMSSLAVSWQSYSENRQWESYSNQLGAIKIQKCFVK